MSRQVGALHRSSSHPANLQNPVPIIPLFAFPPPDFPVINIPSSTSSDTNSDVSVFHTISQFINSDLETPDQFADSGPSPSTHTQTNPSNFSQLPFQPIQTSRPLPSLSTPSYAFQVTPTYTPSLSERSNNNSPDTVQNSSKLDNFITLQQQMTYPHTLTIHHLSCITTSSGPPTPTPLSDYTPSLAHSSTSIETSTNTNRAYRTFKRKFPNHPFTTKPATAKEFINHPQHTNTKTFLQTNLPSFLQYTLNTSTTNKDTRNFVDEHALMPTLHWSSYYHYTNPLFLPICNTQIDNEKCKNMLYRVTTALTPRQFTYAGFKQLFKTFTAPRANNFTIEYYDHNIIRPNQDQFLDDDRFSNPQLTEKFFIKTSYLFTLNIFDKKHDHIVSEALIDMQAYQSFYDQFQLFTLTFHFFSPQERDLHCSHDIMLRTKQTHTYTYYRFKTTSIYTHHLDSPTIVFSLLTQNTRHHFFLILHIASNILTFTASSVTTIPLPKCIYSAPSR